MGTTRLVRWCFCVVVAGAAIGAAPTANASEPEADPDPSYDRFAGWIEGTLGATYYWRMPPSEVGRAGAGIPFHLGVGWRATDGLLVGAVAGGGILMGRAGAVVSSVPAGWMNDGIALTGGLYYG